MAKDKAAKAAKKEEKKANKANKKVDPEIRDTVIKCVAALACFGILSVTVNSGFTKIADAKLATVSTSASEEEEGGASDSEFFSDFEGTGSEGAGTTDTGAADTDATDAGATDADAGSTDTGAADAGSANTATESKTDSKPAASSSAPQSKEDIIKYYNAATAKAFNAKVPFTKDRSTVEKKFEGGAALTGMKDIVYKFMGVGDKNKFAKTVTAEDKDSYHKYLKASTLTANDVTSATCKQSGDNYLITINVKDGSSSVSGGKVVSSNNSPLDRSGLACGDNDKDYWDHKTAENVMSAIDDVPGCGNANISESYKGAVINVVINAKTGNIVQLGASFSFAFNLEKVLASKGTAEAATTILMKDFKW